MLLRADTADAGGGAFADRRQQAGTVRQLRLVEHVRRTGAHRERLEQPVQAFAHIPHLGVGAEVPGVMALAAARDPYARHLLADRDRQIRVGLVIAQLDVEARLELLDPRVFECERLQFRTHYRPFEAASRQHHGRHGHADAVGILGEELFGHDAPCRAAGGTHKGMLGRNFLHEVFGFINCAKVGADSDFLHICKAQHPHAFLQLGRRHAGELIDKGIIKLFNGHGSPSNDLRNGSVPYVKVSDIRNLRINVNPTNLVPLPLAQKFWRSEDGKSNLKEWDLISPSRASSNIGEFAILLPGEEAIVLTKEVFIIRVNPNDFGITPFYLLWALSLKEIRKQWSRITLMQTNREDVGQRFREITVPYPISSNWADTVSRPFREYFEGIANAKKKFIINTSSDDFNYIASVSAFKK